MVIPQVTHEETKRFSGVWNHNGVVIPFDDASIAFATDFANVCLRSLFSQIQPQMVAMAQRIQQLEQPQQKPLVILEGE
jgi:hypothetical protein